MMPGRDTTYKSSYRYGFNGKEMDNETYGGQGNEYDYGMRIYNPRIGRFLSVDPLAKKYPTLTPYQFASNSPIAGVDLDGLEFLPANSSIYQQKYLGSSTIFDVTTNQYVVNTVYENIPDALKDPQTKDLKFTYGGPVTPWGRDWDISKDGAYVSATGRYYNPGPAFWGAAEDATPSTSNSTTGLYNFKTKPDALEQNEANASQLEASAEVGEHAAGIGNNIANALGVWPAMTKENNDRTGFYNATNTVDKYLNKNLIGDKTLSTPVGRADLINFLTDGTLPTGNIPISNLSQNDIEKDLRTFYTGYQIVLKEGVQYRTELTGKFTELNDAYKKNGGKLNFDNIKNFKRPETQ